MSDDVVKTILLVDDSRSIRMIMSASLQEAGYEVLEAENGEQGVEIASDRKIDLILSDLNMPLVDGLEFTRRVRAIPGQQATPILIVTTESHAERKLEGKAAGANGWVVKPIPPDRLLEVVEQTLLKHAGVANGN